MPTIRQLAGVAPAYPARDVRAMRCAERVRLRACVMVHCPACDGTGLTPDGAHYCERCGGGGMVRKQDEAERAE